MPRILSFIAILAALGLAWLFSRDRRAVPWKHVAWGVALQLFLAVLLFRVPGVNALFQNFTEGVRWFVSFGDKGAEFVFGRLAEGKLPVAAAGSGLEIGLADLGAVLILKILPTVIFVSSSMSVLYHLGVLQRVVAAMAWVVQRTLRVSGAEALSGVANVFMGMTEAPLLIRPYLAGMTGSEILAVMVGGFATISGSMMAVYNALFKVDFSFLLAASLLSAPAALYLTKIYLPEKEVPATLGSVRVHFERGTVNVVDAAASGATTGLSLALNIGAVLLAFAAGLRLIDAVLGWAGSFFLAGPEALTLGTILGWLFAPFAWLLGVPASEALAVGKLLGIKMAVNEYFAYQTLSAMKLSARAGAIATFALCGFANFGSIAIQLGGIGGLIPGRRPELARFGIPAMLLGALANFISAAIAGLLLDS